MTTEATPHQPATASPDLATMPEWLEKAFAGDRAGAQRALDERNRNGGVEPTAPKTAASELPPDVAAPQPGVMDMVAEDFREVMGEAGEELIREWGGPEGEDFRQNVAFASHAIEHIRKTDPGFIELLNSVIESEDGTVFRFGDHPTLVRLAARFGRQLAYDIGETVHPLSNTPLQKQQGRQMQNAPSSQQRQSARVSETDSERVSDLTDQIFASSGAKRDRLVRERKALLNRVHGTGPIVGGAGRNA